MPGDVAFRLPWDVLPAVLHTRPVSDMVAPVAAFCDAADADEVLNLVRIARTDADPEALSEIGAALAPVRMLPFLESGVSERNTRLAVEVCRAVFELAVTYEHGEALIKDAAKSNSPAVIRGRMNKAGADGALNVLTCGASAVFILLAAVANAVQFMRLAAVAPDLELQPRVQTIAGRVGVGADYVPEVSEPIQLLAPPKRKRR